MGAGYTNRGRENSERGIPRGNERGRRETVKGKKYHIRSITLEILYPLEHFFLLHLRILYYYWSEISFFSFFLIELNYRTFKVVAQKNVHFTQRHESSSHVVVVDTWSVDRRWYIRVRVRERTVKQVEKRRSEALTVSPLSKNLA